MEPKNAVTYHVVKTIKDKLLLLIYGQYWVVQYGELGS